MQDIEELKNEAAALGVAFKSNISAEKLKLKIEAHYEAGETSEAVIAKAVEAKNEVAPTPTVNKKQQTKRQKREVDSRKTRIVLIVDNDQRSNNHTSTCVVNCSNEYFDLGTRILPLNEKIEVAQGHINVLKEVQIPLHVRNSKTGLSVTKQRARYNISYEDNH